MVVTRDRRRTVLGALVLMALIGLAVLASAASHRIRVEGLRDGILRQLDDASRRGRPLAAMWVADIR